jgi:hypothetical protein
VFDVMVEMLILIVMVTVLVMLQKIAAEYVQVVTLNM